jgi:hypothetical protein
MDHPGGVGRRLGQVIGSLVLIFVAVVGAFLSSQMVFAVVGAAGVVGAAFLIVHGRERDRLSMDRRIGVYESLIGLLLVGGAVCVLVTMLSTLSADVAVGLVAGAALWTLLAAWIHWWNQERQGPAIPAPEDSDPPVVVGEAVSVS